MQKNIVLVGFMGTGKSSVGKALAKKLGRPLMDIDQMIEAKEKRKIGDIFEKDGEAVFRKLEKEMILNVTQKEMQIITTGGGSVLDTENIQRLKQNGVLIALSSSCETIYRRVKDSHHRPLLSGEDLMSQIKRLLETRKPYYAQADLFFGTDDQNPPQVAARILTALKLKETPKPLRKP